MSYETLILESAPPGGALSAPLERLFAQQRAAWPLLAQGLAALRTARVESLWKNGEQVLLQANPGRRRSTHARVDAASIAERPCFLCPDNMPAEERGIACGDYVLLANPYPILPRHCTIPIRDHVPQALAGRLADLFSLAEALGPDMLVFYNGPRCGASAPDHLHFQSCAADPVPLLPHLLNLPRAVPVAPLRHFGRRMLLAGHADREAAQIHLQRALAALPAEPGSEPMVNVLALVRAGRYLSALIPRAAHRPACFFAREPDRVAISPATLEMCGLLVVAESDHFDRVDADLARLIYDQVCLDEASFEHWIEAVR